MKRIIAFILVLVMVTMTFSSFASGESDTRTVIKKVIGTTTDDFQPAYGKKVIMPNISVTEGAPAYFNTDSGTALWYKKTADEKWLRVEEKATFLDGKYKLVFQVRIDGEAGKTHVLAPSAKLEVFVNGEEFFGTQTMIDKDYSYVMLSSREFTIIKPENPPLIFNNTGYFNVNESIVNKAIETVDLMPGASGGTKPYKFTKVSGPSWISVSSDGKITGTPTTVGENEDLAVKLSDSTGYSVDFTVTVKKTNINPSERIVISTMKATAHKSFIPELNKKAIHPNFKVVEGSPAYLDTVNTGSWWKKNAIGADEKIAKGTAFTAGTYYYKCQVSIAAVSGGADYVLKDKGFKMFVNDEEWTASEATIREKSSYLYVTSPDYEVKDSVTPTPIDPEKPTITVEGTYTYTASLITATVKGYDESTMNIIGNTGTNAGEYVVTVTSKTGKWADGTTEAVTAIWTIEKATPTYTVPVGLKGEKGKTLSAVTLTSGWSWLDASQVMNEAGAKKFKANYTPDDTTNYKVLTNIDVEILVEEKTPPTPPAAKTATAPVAKIGLVYNGSEQIGVELSEGYTLSGNKATNAGTYKAVATLESGYKWEDGTTEDKEINWTIKKATPTGNPRYTAITESGKTLGEACITVVGSDFSVPGSVKWIKNDGSDLSNEVIVEYRTYYNWLFIPSDSINFENITGKIMPYSYQYSGYYNDDIYVPNYYKYEIIKGSENSDKYKENQDDKNKNDPSKQIELRIGTNETMLFGKKYYNDVAPKIVNGRIMLPTRFISESLGAKVEWDGNKKMVTIIGLNERNETVVILLTLGSNIAIVNGDKVRLETKVFAENGRTYTPIRFISELLGAKVEWDGVNKKVIIKIK